MQCKFVSARRKAGDAYAHIDVDDIMNAGGQRTLRARCRSVPHFALLAAGSAAVPSCELSLLKECLNSELEFVRFLLQLCIKLRSLLVSSTTNRYLVGLCERIASPSLQHAGYPTALCRGMCP